MANADSLIAALLAQKRSLSPALEEEVKRYIIAARLETEARVRETFERVNALERQRIRENSDKFARERGYRDWDDYIKRDPDPYGNG